MQIQDMQTAPRLVRGTPLRVDAQRNLEHVLRAAREVFGEAGYGAPMEDVARRARVGVGTVYRRFPSKEVLVGRIAEEETARLTEQARAALDEEREPWSALSRFLHTSVASGAGRLLPPRVLQAGSTGGAPEVESAAELLATVGKLVDRAHAAGELRADVTVGDVLLVIATAAPSLPDPTHRAAASTRLLDILLAGLHAHG